MRFTNIKYRHITISHTILYEKPSSCPPLTPTDPRPTPRTPLSFLLFVSCSAAKLRKAFPEMLGPKRSGFIADGVVLSCFEQVMEGIQDNTKNEFEEVLKEFNVQPLLNKLDSVAQASDRSPSDEPPARIKNKGDAETAIVYASFKAKLAAVEQLREQVGAVKRENGALQQEVRVCAHRDGGVGGERRGGGDDRRGDGECRNTPCYTYVSFLLPFFA